MDLTVCVLWKEPERVNGPMQDRFELLETITKSSHWWRYILRCRCCGQNYFFEFYEEVDWESGKDPQFSVWVPFDTDEQLSALKAYSPKQFEDVVPRLCKDWPKEAEKPSLSWIRR
jgi:hypothetical protein